MYTFQPIHYDKAENAGLDIHTATGAQLAHWESGWVQKKGYPKYPISPFGFMDYHYAEIEKLYGPLPVSAQEFQEIMHGINWHGVT